MSQQIGAEFSMRMYFLALQFVLLPWAASICYAEPPSDLDPQLSVSQKGVKLTLVAEHPDVVTPTGVDVDEKGNIWLVCSHTHFRPDDYEGPEHDEIVVLKVDGTRSVFFNQTTATMDLELGLDGWVYLAERDRILRVKDSNNDGKGDTIEELANLKTEADYPHNGLSGLAWHPNGDLIFALGENFWKSWTLTGSDGQKIEGTGEGGIFRCTPQGESVHRIAKGFWNPFGVCVRSNGTLSSRLRMIPVHVPPVVCCTSWKEATMDFSVTTETPLSTLLFAGTGNCEEHFPCFTASQRLRAASLHWAMG